MFEKCFENVSTWNEATILSSLSLLLSSAFFMKMIRLLMEPTRLLRDELKQFQMELGSVTRKKIIRCDGRLHWTENNSTFSSYGMVFMCFFLIFIIALYGICFLLLYLCIHEDIFVYKI